MTDPSQVDGSQVHESQVDESLVRAAMARRWHETPPEAMDERRTDMRSVADSITRS